MERPSSSSAVGGGAYRPPMRCVLYSSARRAGADDSTMTADGATPAAKHALRDSRPAGFSSVIMSTVWSAAERRDAEAAPAVAGARGMGGEPLPRAVLLAEVRQLVAPEGGLELRHAVVVPEHLGAIRARLARRHRGLAVVPQQAGDVGDGRVVGDQHPAFAGHEVLRLLEREDPAVAEGADFAPLVGGAGRLGAVLDDAKAMAPRDFEELVHGSRLPEEVHGDHRAAAQRDDGFHGLRIEAEGLVLDVREDRDG